MGDLKKESILRRRLLAQYVWIIVNLFMSVCPVCEHCKCTFSTYTGLQALNSPSIQLDSSSNAQYVARMKVAWNQLHASPTTTEPTRRTSRQEMEAWTTWPVYGGCL
jgi:hypothetical protein